MVRPASKQGREGRRPGLSSSLSLSLSLADADADADAGNGVRVAADHTGLGDVGRFTQEMDVMSITC